MLTREQQQPQVINRVFKGELGHPTEYLELEALCILRGLTYRYHQGRPTMFSIKLDKCTVLFFSSGRFRMMGKLSEKEAHHLLLFLGLDANLSLTLQTESVKFCVKPVTLFFVYRHQKDIQYEPELFPAIHLTRWKKDFVNLFFSGSVVIMGPTASQTACQVKLWLAKTHLADAKNLPPVLLMDDTFTPKLVPDYDLILRYLPKEVHKKAYSYMKCYPLRLIMSWAQHIATDERLQKQLLQNITNS